MPWAVRLMSSCKAIGRSVGVRSDEGVHAERLGGMQHAKHVIMGRSGASTVIPWALHLSSGAYAAGWSIPPGRA